MNGIIIIDKPEGWTSHDVIGKLRGVLRERRMGHGGTLDPMATGVLPVFVGRATRAVEFCENAEKEYLAGILPGIITDTQDITGTVLLKTPCAISQNALEAVCSQYVGKIQQIPPMYSAVKIGGKKLYQLARKGVEVERKPREITIHSLSVEGKRERGFFLRVVCSKGTYVRTLCHDIGTSLGCGAAMDYLRRVRAGAFTIQQAVTIETVQQKMQEGKLSDILLPVDSLFSEFSACSIDEEQEKRCRVGAEFPVSDRKEGTYRVYSQSGEFLMLGEVKNNWMKTIKSFFEV